MEFVSVSIYTHVLAIYILLAIMVFNMLSVLNVTSFILLANRLRFMTPLFHMMNAIVAYTGATVAAFTHDFSPTIVFMIASTVLIMVLEIKRYKKMRVIRTTDIQKQEEFVIYAKKIYAIEIGAIIFTFVISKIF